MKEELNEWIRMIVTLGVLITLFYIALANATDRNIENQDLMLCQSAEQSGNEFYQNKCQCFYETGDIKCIK